MLDTINLPLFVDLDAQQARLDAVEQLHQATNFYTVTPVVDDLLNRLRWPECGGRLLDPAAGNGQFLVRAVEKLLESGDVTDEDLLARVEGWEIHEQACQQARARVSATLQRHGRSHETAHVMATTIVKNQDFLTQAELSGAVTTVASNPPYLRRDKIPQLLRDEYDALLPSYAVQDLLHSFLLKSSKAITREGQIGIVGADRWLYAQGAAILRETLGSQLRIRHMAKLDCKSSFFRPKSRRAGTLPRVHPVAIVLGGGSGQELTKKPIYPSATTTDYGRYPKLRDLATVRLGSWLGPDEVFLVTAEQARASGLPDDVLVPVAGAKDIVDDTLQAPTRYAIRTTPATLPSEQVIKHLNANMHLMPPSALRKRRNTPWVPPEAFHNTPLDQPTLLVRRISRTPQAIRLPAGVLAIDHHLSITPNDPAMFSAIERALMAPIAQQWMQERARPLEEDWFELTATVLRDMPIDLNAI
ncbi:N-6 DNA methylase [Duganella vulcania]|uniref:site-specific DNA-methyltransferase (adenine-specific) n=1 Tax=Duganella vulcania TaxID=2692166 RepID=A0A845GDK7_9BURK|nr:N-6 DNA methylase [Duganella vulcania]MYM92354.1 N-6 DNA methylase [Duganella vulcania]